MRTRFSAVTSIIANTLHFLTRTSLLTGCACGVLHAQQDLEGSLPSNWTASTGTLSISPNHYKMGSESLRWDWSGGDTITISSPGITAADVLLYAKNTCDFWVWNGTAVSGGKLRVEFMNGSTAQYWFDFYLDFTGWRHAVRSYRYDMSKKSSPSTTFTSVRITAPTTGAGSFYFDAVTWVGNRSDRIRDAQNPDITGEVSNTLYSDSYAQIPTVADTEPTPAELADLTTLRAQWLDSVKGNSAPSATSVTSATASYDALNIVAGADGIKGAVVGKDTNALKGWPLVLALDYAWNPSSATGSRDNMLLLASHLLDQGHAANSNELPTDPSGINYNYRDLPTALILTAPAYDAATKQKLWDWFRWAYHMGDFWSTTWERNIDDIHLHSVQQLGAILFLTNSDKEAVRQLKGHKLYLDRFWEISEGSDGGVKVDGTGFHHVSHYNNYMYAYTTMTATTFILRGTSFQISKASYENLRLAFMTYMRMSADSVGSTFGYFGNSLCGRKPMSTDTSFSQAAMRQLGEVGGPFYGSSVDSVVAQAYNRRFGTSNYSLFSDSGVEPSPDGFYQFNYSPLGIYRRGTWVASIRAPQRYFWSAEIWTNENVYGRYQGYGALEMLYNGKVISRAPKDANGNNLPKVVTVRSGQSADGWDWSQPPGTTTIALPHDKLGMKEREDVRSQLNFSGALAFRADLNGGQSQSGLYAANFQESKPGSIVGLNHNLSFVWRKSWFCFGSQIVCLGSDIANQNTVENAAFPTVTTLFQGVLPTRTTAITLNDTSITSFPYAPAAVGGAGANWLLDAYGTGFIVQPQTGNTLKISRTNQESAHHTGSGAITTDDYAKAWIDHGTSPTGAGYEYTVFPATTPSAMVTAATAHANAATKPYQVLQRDSTAHVVKWKANAQVGYAIFTNAPLSPATQNVGMLISVERPCLVMAQLGTSGDAWVSVVDPDLNFSNLQAAYNLPDASVARTLDFTVHGTWIPGSSSAGTSIIPSPGGSNTTTIRVTTRHGLASHVRLISPPATGVASWANLATDWTDPANWGANWGGSPPANDPATDIAALGAATVQPVLDSPYSVKGLTLDGGTTLSGIGNLTLGAGGVITTGTGNAFSLSNITLHTGQTWDIDAGNLDVSSVIAGLASASLTKAGSGTLTLSGANTYLGDTTVSAGILTVQNDQSSANGGWMIGPANTATTVVNFDSVSTVAVANGKKIQIGGTGNSGSSSTATLNVAGTVTNSGTLQVGRAATLTLNSGAIWNQSGNLSLTGLGGAAAALNIHSGAAMTYSGANTVKLNLNNGSSRDAILTIDGTGILTTGAGFENAATGITTTPTGNNRVTLTNGGTIKLSADVANLTTQTQFSLESGGGVIDNNGFNTTLSGVVDVGTTMTATGISGSGSLTSQGSGTLTLTGVNTYTGGTTVTGGVLSTGFLANSGSDSGIGRGTLILDGGTLKYTGGNIGFWSRNFTIGSNGASFDLSEATGDLRINGAIAFSGSGARSLTITTASPGGRLTNALGDAEAGVPTTLVKNGSGPLILQGANSYTGPLQILQGAVQYGNGGSGGESSGVGHSVAISSGATLIFRHTGTDVVTYNAPISGDGKVSFNYSNSANTGSLTLGGNNTFTGGLTLNPTGSTNVLPLKAGGPSALGSGTVSIGQYGKLDLNGYSNTTGLLVSTHNAATVTNDGSTDATLTLGGTDTQTYGGAISDGPTNKISIVKSGTGIQSLTGANSYSGDTTVTGGTLSLGQVNPNNESSTVTIASNSVLILAFTGTDTVHKLFINGTQQPAGDYTNSHPSAAISGGGTLHVTSGPSGNVVGPSGYSAWAAANAPGQTADMDHDSDGMKNGIESFMGLSGSGFTANPAPDANRLVTWPMGANYSGAYGTDYLIQTSPDLDSWSDVLESGVTITTGISVSYTVTGSGPQFVRLVVWPD